MGILDLSGWTGEAVDQGKREVPMERTKRKNVFRAELIIFLAVIAVSLLVLWIRWENSHATYKNYDIVDYNRMVEKGYIE